MVDQCLSTLDHRFIHRWTDRIDVLASKWVKKNQNMILQNIQLDPVRSFSLSHIIPLLHTFTMLITSLKGFTTSNVRAVPCRLTRRLT